MENPFHHGNTSRSALWPQDMAKDHPVVALDQHCSQNAPYARYHTFYEVECKPRPCQLSIYMDKTSMCNQSSKKPLNYTPPLAWNIYAFWRCVKPGCMRTLRTPFLSTLYPKFIMCSVFHALAEVWWYPPWLFQHQHSGSLNCTHNLSSAAHQIRDCFLITKIYRPSSTSTDMFLNVFYE